MQCTENDAIDGLDTLVDVLKQRGDVFFRRIIAAGRILDK